MSISNYFVDYGAGNDTTGDGTIGTPWKTIQKALDTLTRNTTDGNQVNLKAGTAHVNAAALDLATLIGGGALGTDAPLIVRGYTSAANDGGVGEIDCGGATMFAAATYDYVILADLEIHSGGDNDTVSLDASGTLYRVEVHEGASTPSSAKYLVKLGSYGHLIGCHIHDTPARGVSIGVDGFLYGCYIADTDGFACIFSGTGGTAVNNLVKLSTVGAIGFYTAVSGVRYIGNAIYNSAAGTSYGLSLSFNNGLAFNNIISGFSGVGGRGISAPDNSYGHGYNAFYNNTANYSIADQTYLSETGNDVFFGTDPFTNAGSGDFSLTSAAQTALRSLGWPAVFAGAHANSDAHTTIGPMQYGPTPTGGGGIYQRVMRLMGG